MKNSNYVAAGYNVIWRFIEQYLNGSKGSYYNNFSREDLCNFFKQTCNQFLISYGNDYGKINRMKPDQYSVFNENIAKIISTCRTEGFFQSPDIKLKIDSGGYQVAEGRISKNGLKNLEELYYTFLVENDNLYNEAFILDLPPGKKNTVFSNYNELYKRNLKSYEKAAALPEDIRKKVVYIHHTRTPMLHKIFTDILRQNDFFLKFENYATGGMVSNSSSDKKIPYFIYIFPLVQLLNEAIKTGRKSFDYHILGGSSFRDVFSYAFVKHHIQETHNITVNINFDSINALNSFRGLPIPIVHNDRIIFHGKSSQFSKISQRENVVDQLNAEFKRFSNEFNFKPIEVGYREDGNWDYDTELYLLLYTLHTYKQIEIFSEEKAKELYPLFKNGEPSEFNMAVEKIFRNLNGGRITPKHNAKFHALEKSLNLLTFLDEDHCQYIINKYLSYSEFNNLIDENLIHTI